MHIRDDKYIWFKNRFNNRVTNCKKIDGFTMRLENQDSWTCYDRFRAICFEFNTRHCVCNKSLNVLMAKCVYTGLYKIIIQYKICLLSITYVYVHTYIHIVYTVLVYSGINTVLYGPVPECIYIYVCLK